MRVTIDVPDELGHEAPYDLVRRLRASISVLGPLVARCGRARVALPGGDNIGSRGLDMHITGLHELGAQVRIEHGFVVAEVPERLRGANLWLDFPSVGATENLLMAAVLADGTTVIDNVAREPEISDLCEMLIAMGADIEGVTTSTLTVRGVDSLRRWSTPPCRTGSCPAPGPSRRRSPAASSPCTAAGPTTSTSCSTSWCPPGPSRRAGRRRLQRARRQAARAPFDVVTLPYPGFPTDLQPFAMALAVGQRRHGDDHRERLRGAVHVRPGAGPARRRPAHRRPPRGRARQAGALRRPVVAHDIRAGAALVLAGLAAQGTTTVAESHHIDRATRASPRCSRARCRGRAGRRTGFRPRVSATFRLSAEVMGWGWSDVSQGVDTGTEGAPDAAGYRRATMEP